MQKDQASVVETQKNKFYYPSFSFGKEYTLISCKLEIDYMTQQPKETCQRICRGPRWIVLREDPKEKLLRAVIWHLFWYSGSQIEKLYEIKPPSYKDKAEGPQLLRRNLKSISV